MRTAASRPTRSSTCGSANGCAPIPIFAETRAYRRYHLQHHARTQQEDDPDLILSAPFPITKASYKRKFWRDITGRTGYEQRKAQLRMALGDPGWPLRQRAAHFWDRLGPQVVVNALLFAGLAAAGVWWAYPLLWLLPMVTWFMVITRIRNIAEHAVVGEADDPLRNTRTTLTNWLERAFVAPYFVNYHLEHHLFYYVPCYNLPKLHRILRSGPHGAPHGDCAGLRGGAAQGHGAARPRGPPGRAGARPAPAGQRQRELRQGRVLIDLHPSSRTRQRIGTMSRQDRLRCTSARCSSPRKVARRVPKRSVILRARGRRASGWPEERAARDRIR